MNIINPLQPVVNPPPMNAIDNSPEPHDPLIFHADKKYYVKQELGRGTQGIVYLYEEDGDSSKKIAVKVARLTDRYSAAAINKESNLHKKLSAIVGLNKYVPAYLGQTYFDKAPVIKSEYIS
jgi:hypothetical protein